MSGPNIELVGEVCNMVVAHMPHYQIDSVAEMGEGTDNMVLAVNGELRTESSGYRIERLAVPIFPERP